ncbi:hypothetical protein AVEN_197283-1 [Araneus ventricosus]|uniref:Uncharacterized protein n=1 Tax=Araneus ventricosus TaxID=182803 RepID=A0A4Y2B918_ARAVE|nr:hypothetical protein AVEN_197283-1 [Araneus ventricosus]
MEVLGEEWKLPDADRHLLGAAPPPEVEKKKRKRRDNDEASKRPRIDIVQQATNQNISVPEQQQMLFDHFGQQQFILEDLTPTFLQSPAPLYTPGTSLDTMVTIETLQLQITELQKQLSALQNSLHPDETCIDWSLGGGGYPLAFLEDRRRAILTSVDNTVRMQRTGLSQSGEPEHFPVAFGYEGFYTREEAERKIVRLPDKC